MKCEICKKEIKKDIFGWEGGHNAEPVKNGRCCANCNDNIVIPRRILKSEKNESNKMY